MSVTYIRRPDEGPSDACQTCSNTRAFLGMAREMRSYILSEIEAAAARHPEDELLGGLVDEIRGIHFAYRVAGEVLLPDLPTRAVAL